MTKIDPDLYRGREQTYVKHYVLANYLERLAHIVGPHFRALTYIDAFAGPWENRNDALEDTSPGIATRVLMAARDAITARGGTTSVRGMFIEKNAQGVESLKRSLSARQGLELHVTHGAFQDLVPQALEFAAVPYSFCFTFIDPCGWTGMDLSEITPLLRIHPSEVLINFMTNDINRFIDSPDPRYAPQFEGMFGSLDFRQAWARLEGEARQDTMVRTYCERIRAAGGFRYVVSAVVANPLQDRAYFHLVYATREEMGLKVFRDIERIALKQQGAVRVAATQRKRESGGQRDLFPITEYAQDRYINQLCDRHRQHALEVIVKKTPVG